MRSHTTKGSRRARLFDGPQAEQRVDFGAPRSRVNPEFAPEILRSSAHVGQSHSVAGDARIESAAVVDDTQMNEPVMVFTPELDRDFAGSCVSLDVRERLLCNAKQSHTLPFADAQRADAIEQRDLGPRALFQVPRELVQCCHEAELIDGSRPERMRDAAHVDDAVIEACQAFVETLLGPRGISRQPLPTGFEL